MTVASTAASGILAALGQDFSVPAVDLTDEAYLLPDHSTDDFYTAPAERTLEELTTGAIDGDGAFDKLMVGLKAHLTSEFEKGRISAADFTKAYIELTSMAMQGAMEFLFRSRENDWSIRLAQMQTKKAEAEAVMAGVMLETSKHQLAAAVQQQNLLKAQNALVTLQLATEDVKYNLALQQIELVKEQTEVQRAQTKDERTDSTTVAGLLGTQKALYEEQIASYEKDAQHKIFRSMLDAWITNKSVIETTDMPTGLNNTEITAVLTKLRTNNSLT